MAIVSRGLCECRPPLPRCMNVSRRWDTSQFMWHKIKHWRRPRTPSTSISWEPTWGHDPEPRVSALEHSKGMLSEESIAHVGSENVTVDRLLSKLGLCSRTEAGRLIERGRITVNGRPIVQNKWVNVREDSILVNGTPLEATCRLTLLMHKPAGCMVSRDDPLNRDTVFQLLPDPSVYIGASGRLDKDTTGLLLLTNDTYLQASLVDPAYKVPKVYRVVVKGAPLNGAQLMALRSGVSLEDGPTLPTLVEPLDANGNPLPLEMSEYDRYTCKQFNITLWEGRNRQVRRMVEAVGSTVRDLCRIQLGPFAIDEVGLPSPGDVRELSREEVESLKAYINSQAMRTKRGQSRRGSRAMGVGS